MKDKEMNQEAKDALNEIVNKMNKEAQTKRKQAEDLLASAKVLEETTQKLTKEIDSIKVKENEFV